jgi:hypothetical protein
MLSILLLLKLVQRRAWVVTSAIKCRLNKSLKAVTSSINHIIADIFGRERQSEKGLIDSMSADFFNNQLKEFSSCY